MTGEKITLYIHIGAPKTGSSSIQNFLAGNMRLLWDSCSCLYPNMDRRHFLDTHFINHQKLFIGSDIKSQKEKILAAIQYCRRHSGKKIVLSAEVLFESAEGPALMKELLSIKGIDLKIIVYLRRQDQWLESAWKEWGYKSHKFPDISHYIKQRDCNWLHAIRRWENAVGKDHLIIRCYEKEQLPSGLIQDFITTLNIDYTAVDWIPQKDLFKGFQRDVMEVLFLNKDFCRNETDLRLQMFIERNLDESFQKVSFKSYSFLSPSERIFILKMYDEGNRELAREFLGRSDGMLFYEPWPSPDEPWRPYDGLTVEKIVPIFTRILYNMEIHNAGEIGRIRGDPPGNQSNSARRSSPGMIRRMLVKIRRKFIP